jgi:hypothetical protein
MRTLVDTGASQNYARRRSMAANSALLGAAQARQDGHISVKMADGATTTTKKVKLDLKIEFLDFKGTESFFVIDLDDRYDLILGMPWLKKNQPWIDWSELTMGSSAPPQESFFYGALECNEPSTIKKPALLKTSALVKSQPADRLVKTVRFADVASKTCCRDTRHVSPPHHVKMRSESEHSLVELDAAPRVPAPQMCAAELESEHSSVELDAAPRVPAPRMCAEEMVLSICDLSELPRQASDILALPELSFEEFAEALSSHDICGIAVPQMEPEELNTSSTMDEAVDDTKEARFAAQGWDSLRSSPFYDLL